MNVTDIALELVYASDRGRPIDEASVKTLAASIEVAGLLNPISVRRVRRDVHRGEALGDAALTKIAHTSLDKGEELDALTKLAPEARDSLIDRAAAGEKVKEISK